MTLLWHGAGDTDTSFRAGPHHAYFPFPFLILCDLVFVTLVDFGESFPFPFPAKPLLYSVRVTTGKVQPTLLSIHRLHVEQDTIYVPSTGGGCRGNAGKSGLPAGQSGRCSRVYGHRRVGFVRKWGDKLEKVRSSGSCAGGGKNVLLDSHKNQSAQAGEREGGIETPGWRNLGEVVVSKGHCGSGGRMQPKGARSRGSINGLVNALPSLHSNVKWQPLGVVSPPDGTPVPSTNDNLPLEGVLPVS